MLPRVVRYKGKYYCHYNTTANGGAKLLDFTGAKFSGTPQLDKLEVVKDYKLVARKYNNHTYFSTKLGVFSASTGNKISSNDILSLF